MPTFSAGRFVIGGAERAFLAVVGILVPASHVHPSAYMTMELHPNPNKQELYGEDSYLNNDMEAMFVHP